MKVLRTIAIGTATGLLLVHDLTAGLVTSLVTDQE